MQEISDNRLKYQSSNRIIRGDLVKYILCGLVIVTVYPSASAKDIRHTTHKKRTEPKASACHHPEVHKSASPFIPFQNQSIPDVQVVDQLGKRQRFYSDLVSGKIVVINFIFTTCEALCPIQGKAFEKIQEAFNTQSANQVELISITLDPQRDSPERLKSWGEQFGARPGWTLVTGEKSQMDKLLEVLTGDPSGKREHSSVMLIGNARTNRWSRTYSFAPPERVREIVEELNNPQITRP
jgi:protein SCO1/2